MSIVAHTYPFVIGADTHSRNHALAILAPTGEVIDEQIFPTTKTGLARAVDWACRRTGGDLDALWVIEGIGTYGAQLAQTHAPHRRRAPTMTHPQVERAAMVVSLGSS